MIGLNDKNFDKEVLAENIPVAVEFWHEQCEFCKRLSPVYEELAKEYEGKVKFTKLDIKESHENFHIALRYGILSTPTIKLFCQGRVIGELIGYMPKEVLKKEMDNFMQRAVTCLENSTEMNEKDEEHPGYMR